MLLCPPTPLCPAQVPAGVRDEGIGRVRFRPRGAEEAGRQDPGRGPRHRCTPRQGYVKF